jgi:hypothetical protein
MDPTKIHEALILLSFFLFGCFLSAAIVVVGESIKTIHDCYHKICSEIESAIKYHTNTENKSLKKRTVAFSKFLSDFALTTIFGIGYLLLCYDLTDGSFRIIFLLCMLIAFLCTKRLLRYPISFLIGNAGRLLSIPISKIGIRLTRLFLSLLKIIPRPFLKSTKGKKRQPKQKEKCHVRPMKLWKIHKEAGK